MTLDWVEYSTLVGQAAGMVSVQAGCSTDEAMKLLRQHARSTDTTVEEVAERVVDRRIRIEAQL